MSHKALFAVLLALGLSAGCVFAHVPKQATMVGLGKVSAEHCVDVADPEADDFCIKIEGQGFTEGFVKFLSDALTVIPRMLAGAAAGAVTTQ